MVIHVPYSIIAEHQSAIRILMWRYEMIESIGDKENIKPGNSGLGQRPPTSTAFQVACALKKVDVRDKENCPPNKLLDSVVTRMWYN